MTRPSCRPGSPGTDLTLTIDAGLQLRVEQELLAAWVADKAKRVSAVVMDPYTGEVYAMATYPSYDGNDYKAIAATEPSRFIDPIVSAVYEPGSVFKMMTAAAALTKGTVTPSTRIKDTGTLRLDNGKTKIDDADRKGMGWMSFEDGVAYSRNVVAAKVALGLGKTTKESSAILYDMWMRLGYGQPTGIDVAGEVGGLVRDPGLTDWRQIDLANGAFGQGVAVTPIQLAMAYAALANGGTLVQPHVVKAIGDRQVVATPRAEGVVDASRLGHARPHDEARHHRGARSTATGRSSRATTSAARRAPRRSGIRRRTAAAAPGNATSSTTRSSDGSGARRACPTSSSPSRSRRGLRRSSRSVTWRCRSCRSSSSGGSRPTPSRRPTCCATARSDSTGRRTGDRRLWDTGRP